MVTGASRGIGRGLALALAKAGAKVAVTAPEPFRPDPTGGEIRRGGGEAEAFPADLGRVAEIGTTFDSVVRHYGRVDILVNNAGLGFNHDAVDVTEADWDG